MDRVQMRNQQDRRRPWCVQKASLFPHGISVLNQLGFQRLLETFLRKLKDLFKLQHRKLCLR